MTIEERAKQKLEEIRSLFGQGKIDGLSSYAQGIAAGTQQVLLWLLDPHEWMDPIKTIPALNCDEAPNKLQPT